MDYKKLWSGEVVRPRRPTLAPWQNEEEGWECDMFPAKNTESPRSKSCIPQLPNTSKKKVVLEYVKPVVQNFTVKRARPIQTSKREVRCKVKINSINQTFESNHTVGQPAPERPSQPPNKKEHKYRFFTEQVEPRKGVQSPSPQLIAPSKHRFSTISVEEVNKSLKATLRLFRETLQDKGIQKVLSTPSTKCKQTLGIRSPNRSSKKYLRPQKAVIVMPAPHLGLPQEFANPYSFSFFRNSKLTQSLPKQPRRKVPMFKNPLPALPN